MKHHTKDKGDLGLGFVLADLLKSGLVPAIPLSEHQPYDCIVASPQGELKRLSVKYRHLSARERDIIVELRSSWADRHGTHTRVHGTNDYDAIAVYNPESEKVFYIRQDELKKRLVLKPTDERVNPQRLFE